MERGKNSVALAHPQSAGHGLNLQKAGTLSCGLGLRGLWSFINKPMPD